VGRLRADSRAGLVWQALANMHPELVGDGLGGAFGVGDEPGAAGPGTLLPPQAVLL
jgi:hypothetical protein